MFISDTGTKNVYTTVFESISSSSSWASFTGSYKFPNSYTRSGYNDDLVLNLQYLDNTGIRMQSYFIAPMSGWVLSNSTGFYEYNLLWNFISNNICIWCFYLYQVFTYINSNESLYYNIQQFCRAIQLF